MTPERVKIKFTLISLDRLTKVEYNKLKRFKKSFICSGSIRAKERR